MHYQVIIVGAGTGGIMTAGQLLKKDKSLSIAIIDPAEIHYYQPAFTLVGAGTYDYENTIRFTKDLIPKKATWIQDFATEFNPESKTVSTKENGTISYDILVVATGLVNDLDGIEGLREGLEKGVVCSNYVDSRKTWELLKAFKGGNAVFTQPTTPIKCGGAPQKAAYMAADYFRKKGLSDKTNIVFATPGSVIFGVKTIVTNTENSGSNRGFNSICAVFNYDAIFFWSQ